MTVRGYGSLSILVAVLCAMRHMSGRNNRLVRGYAPRPLSPSLSPYLSGISASMLEDLAEPTAEGSLLLVGTLAMLLPIYLPPGTRKNRLPCVMKTGLAISTPTGAPYLPSLVPDWHRAVVLAVDLLQL